MSSKISVNRGKNVSANDNRSQLLAKIPAKERLLTLAGLATAILEGGEGPPIILLHGPGETSVWWMRVIPLLVNSHRVIVPDLPGHGSSEIDNNIKDTTWVLQWLDQLIGRTCSSPPVLVGHLLGGAIAARFATAYDKQLDQLVLVNSFGLGKFRPSPSFAFRLIRFLARPTEKNYSQFLPKCIYDVESLRAQMGKQWKPFLAYNLESARTSKTKSALPSLMKNLGIPKISSEKLAQITVPTSLIWGRHDRANKLPIAENASEQFDWPLYIIEEARDDPKLERPEAFLDALHQIINPQNKVSYDNQSKPIRE